METKEMMTKAQVCALLHISLQTLDNWVRGSYQSGSRRGYYRPEGFPAPVRIGRGVRFFVSEIEAYLAGARA